jgi:hypothetical protein
MHVQGRSETVRAGGTLVLERGERGFMGYYRRLCLGVEDCCNGDFISSNFLCNLFESARQREHSAELYVNFFFFFASNNCSEIVGSFSSTVL